MEREKDITEQEKISIIMPVYNAEKYLRESIQSVINQTYQNWELIAVDDGSSDSSRLVLSMYAQKDKRIVPIFSERNTGVGAARNQGIKNAVGRYIAFLDSDDIWLGEKLERQWSFMKEKGCAFTYTSYALVDEAGKPLNQNVKVPLTITYRQALTRTAIWTCTVMIDRKKIADFEMPILKYGAEDSATWLALLKKVPCAYGIQEELSLYRQVPGSLSHNLKARLIRHWILYRKVEKLGLLESIFNYIKYIRYVLTKRRAS